MNGYEGITLSLSEQVEGLIGGRAISHDDIRRTIYHAEKTGERFFNPGASHFLASFRPDRVTFWVEYSKEGGTYQIHTAYSHRTEMKRKGHP